MTSEEKTSLPLKIESAISSILAIYGVPEEMRKIKISKIFALDYRALGKRVLGEFKDYINTVNEQNLKQAIREKQSKT